MVEKEATTDTVIVAEGNDHPALFCDELYADPARFSSDQGFNQQTQSYRKNAPAYSFGGKARSKGARQQYHGTFGTKTAKPAGRSARAEAAPKSARTRTRLPSSRNSSKVSEVAKHLKARSILLASSAF